MNTTSRDDVCKDSHRRNTIAHSYSTRENAARKRIHQRAIEKSCMKWFERYAEKYEVMLR